MLLAHVLGRVGLLGEVAVRERVGGEHDRAAAELLDRRPRRLAEHVHLPDLLVRRRLVPVGPAVRGEPDHGEVPGGAQHVQRHDRPVVHAERGVAHGPGQQAALLRLLHDRLGQLGVDGDVVVEAEEVGEDRVDGLAAQVGHGEHVVADRGDPVRGVDDEHVRLQALELGARSLVRPPDHLPAALRPGLVLRRVLAVEELRRVGSEEAARSLRLASARDRSRRRPAGRRPRPTLPDSSARKIPSMSVAASRRRASREGGTSQLRRQGDGDPGHLHAAGARAQPSPARPAHRHPPLHGARPLRDPVRRRAARGGPPPRLPAGAGARRPRRPGHGPHRSRRGGPRPARARGCGATAPRPTSPSSSAAGWSTWTAAPAGTAHR